MAYSKEYQTDDGRVYYRIRCRISRDQPEHSMRWYVPDGWSQKAIERELAKVEAEFDRKCHEGEVMTKRQRAELEAQEKAANEAILTVEKYGKNVFLPYKSKAMTANSRNSFETMLRLHVYPIIGEKRITDVSTADLVTLLADMQNKRSHATVIKVYTVLRLLFDLAYQTDVITRNPMDKVNRPKQNKDENLQTGVECYTVEELREIIHALSAEPLKWQCLIMILIETGIRRGECVGIQWQDIDGTTIHINRTVNYTPSAGVYVGTPKSGKTRTVYISKETADLLKQYHDSMGNKNKDGFVFTQDKTEKPMHPQSPGRYLQKLGAKHGFINLHPHKLRHSFASIAIQRGADIVSVSEILGHADTAITLRVYSHASEDSRKRAALALQNALADDT